MDEKISKVEIELLSAAIDRIVMQEVLEDELLGTLPKVDELNLLRKVNNYFYLFYFLSQNIFAYHK